MTERGPDPGSHDVPAPMGTDDLDAWDRELFAADDHSLVDLVNHVLDKGVVITGDITLSVAGVDLVYLGLSAVLTSVSSARRKLNRPVGAEDEQP